MSRLLPFTTQLLNRQHISIEAWFQAQWKDVKPPFYASVDLRDSQFKLTAIDTNLFPAGFNNLSLEDQGYAPELAKKAIQQWDSDCKRILIITENHTRNTYYLENVAHLKSILESAGFFVGLSNFNSEPYSFRTQAGHLLEWKVLERTDHYIHVGNFVPDCILLNNDLTEGVPDCLQGVSQTILPPAELGWYQRSKSNYFQHYHTVCQRFAQSIDIDVNRLSPLFIHYSPVNFKNENGRAALTLQVEQLFASILQQYQLHQYEQKPYVVIKADSGSYGMGVMSINDPKDVLHLSRGKRSHMLKTKGNRSIESVILQEGIPTVTRWDDRVAEPVLYLMGSEVVGAFYRTHQARTVQDNLNTPGMELIPIEWQKSSLQFEHGESNLYAYSVVARLAVLAAAYEIAGTS